VYLGVSKMCIGIVMCFGDSNVPLGGMVNSIGGIVKCLGGIIQFVLVAL